MCKTCLKKRALSRNDFYPGTILLYALVGTVWNTVSIGLLLFGGHLMGWYVVDESGVDMSVLTCFLFSALISAVDPVAVLAVFEVLEAFGSLMREKRIIVMVILNGILKCAKDRLESLMESLIRVRPNARKVWNP